MSIEEMLFRLKRLGNCSIREPSGIPSVRRGETLPDDLVEFYSRCGGATLYNDQPFSIDIASPQIWQRSNPKIAGVEESDDISDSWYVIANHGSTQYVSIDCGPGRLGRVYDSFWDCHALVGDCRVIALSFSEFLERCIASEGKQFYWCAENYAEHGDAYD